MVMALIGGWTEVMAFAEDEEKAKRLALKEKKRRCRDDLEKWTWKRCDEYYGTIVKEVKDGVVLTDF